MNSLHSASTSSRPSSLGSHHQLSLPVGGATSCSTSSSSHPCDPYVPLDPTLVQDPVVLGRLAMSDRIRLTTACIPPDLSCPPHLHDQPLPNPTEMTAYLRGWSKEMRQISWAHPHWPDLAYSIEISREDLCTTTKSAWELAGNGLTWLLVKNRAWLHAILTRIGIPPEEFDTILEALLREPLTSLPHDWDVKHRRTGPDSFQTGLIDHLAQRLVDQMSKKNERIAQYLKTLKHHQHIDDYRGLTLIKLFVRATAIQKETLKCSTFAGEYYTLRLNEGPVEESDRPERHIPIEFIEVVREYRPQLFTHDKRTALYGEKNQLSGEFPWEGALDLLFRRRRLLPDKEIVPEDWPRFVAPICQGVTFPLAENCARCCLAIKRLQKPRVHRIVSILEYGLKHRLDDDSSAVGPVLINTCIALWDTLDTDELQELCKTFLTKLTAMKRGLPPTGELTFDTLLTQQHPICRTLLKSIWNEGISIRTAIRQLQLFALVATASHPDGVELDLREHNGSWSMRLKVDRYALMVPFTPLNSAAEPAIDRALYHVLSNGPWIEPAGNGLHQLMSRCGATPDWLAKTAEQLPPCLLSARLLALASFMHSQDAGRQLQAVQAIAAGGGLEKIPPCLVSDGLCVLSYGHGIELRESLTTHLKDNLTADQWWGLWCTGLCHSSSDQVRLIGLALFHRHETSVEHKRQVGLSLYNALERTDQRAALGLLKTLKSQGYIDEERVSDCIPTSSSSSEPVLPLPVDLQQLTQTLAKSATEETIEVGISTLRDTREDPRLEQRWTLLLALAHAIATHKASSTDDLVSSLLEELTFIKPIKLLARRGKGRREQAPDPSVTISRFLAKAGQTHCFQALQFLNDLVIKQIIAPNQQIHERRKSLITACLKSNILEGLRCWVNSHKQSPLPSQYLYDITGQLEKQLQAAAVDVEMQELILEMLINGTIPAHYWSLLSQHVHLAIQKQFITEPADLKKLTTILTTASAESIYPVVVDHIEHLVSTGARALASERVQLYMKRFNQEMFPQAQGLFHAMSRIVEGNMDKDLMTTLNTLKACITTQFSSSSPAILYTHLTPWIAHRHLLSSVTLTSVIDALIECLPSTSDSLDEQQSARWLDILEAALQIQQPQAARRILSLMFHPNDATRQSQLAKQTSRLLRDRSILIEAAEALGLCDVNDPDLAQDWTELVILLYDRNHLVLAYNMMMKHPEFLTLNGSPHEIVTAMFNWHIEDDKETDTLIDLLAAFPRASDYIWQSTYLRINQGATTSSAHKAYALLSTCTSQAMHTRMVCWCSLVGVMARHKMPELFQLASGSMDVICSGFFDEWNECPKMKAHLFEMLIQALLSYGGIEEEVGSDEDGLNTAITLRMRVEPQFNHDKARFHRINSDLCLGLALCGDVDTLEAGLNYSLRALEYIKGSMHEGSTLALSFDKSSHPLGKVFYEEIVPLIKKQVQSLTNQPNAVLTRFSDRLQHFFQLLIDVRLSPTTLLNIAALLVLSNQRFAFDRGLELINHVIDSPKSLLAAHPNLSKAIVDFYLTTLSHASANVDSHDLFDTIEQHLMSCKTVVGDSQYGRLLDMFQTRRLQSMRLHHVDQLLEPLKHAISLLPELLPCLPLTSDVAPYVLGEISQSMSKYYLDSGNFDQYQHLFNQFMAQLPQEYYRGTDYPLHPTAGIKCHLSMYVRTIDLLCQAIIHSSQPSIEALRFVESAMQKLIKAYEELPASTPSLIRSAIAIYHECLMITGYRVDFDSIPSPPTHVLYMLSERHLLYCQHSEDYQVQQLLVHTGEILHVDSTHYFSYVEKAISRLSRHKTSSALLHSIHLLDVACVHPNLKRHHRTLLPSLDTLISLIPAGAFILINGRASALINVLSLFQKLLSVGGTDAVKVQYLSKFANAMQGLYEELQERHGDQPIRQIIDHYGAQYAIIAMATVACSRLSSIMQATSKSPGAYSNCVKQSQEITEKAAVYADSSLFSDKIFWSADRTRHKHDKFSIEFDCARLATQWISCIAQTEPNIALTRFEYVIRNGWLSDYPEFLKTAQNALPQIDSSSTAARSKD